VRGELIFGATTGTGGCVNIFVSWVNFLENNEKFLEFKSQRIDFR